MQVLHQYCCPSCNAIAAIGCRSGGVQSVPGSLHKNVVDRVCSPLNWH